MSKELPLSVKIAAAISIPVAIACGGKGTGGETKTPSTVENTPKIVASPTVEASSIPEAINFTPAVLHATTENALTQIDSRSYEELQKQFNSGTKMTQKDQDVMTVYSGLLDAEKALNGYLADPEKYRLAFFNTLNVSGQRIGKLYCSEPKPSLASLFHIIKSFLKQEVQKAEAEGKKQIGTWKEYERVSFTPNCPIPEPQPQN
ncbi:MAG TPA: hypothetical protein VIK81_04945 [Patescibacteria group bacterium]